MLAKYQQRSYVAMHASEAAALPGGSVQSALWVAAQKGDLHLALRCLVSGAEVAHRCAALSPASQL